MDQIHSDVSFTFDAFTLHGSHCGCNAWSDDHQICHTQICWVCWIACKFSHQLLHYWGVYSPLVSWVPSCSSVPSFSFYHALGFQSSVSWCSLQADRLWEPPKGNVLSRQCYSQDLHFPGLTSYNPLLTRSFLISMFAPAVRQLVFSLLLHSLHPERRLSVWSGQRLPLRRLHICTASDAWDSSNWSHCAHAAGRSGLAIHSMEDWFTQRYLAL